MSASDKKKLRKEQTSAILSKRQKQEQAEAKKLRIYTISFVSIMLAVVVIALAVLGVRAFNHSGIMQKNTIAATIGDRQLNSVELGYYYTDAVNNYYNEWYQQYNTYTDSYLQAVGLDATKPLDEQVFDENTGKTWDEYFVELAVNNAKSDYALYDLAQAENFTLPEDEQTSLDTSLTNLQTYASLYGYSGADQYLRAIYGYGAELDSYKAYSERSAIAQAFEAAHLDSLTYEDADIREYEKDKAANYNSYTYSSAYLSYTDFRVGGTEDENGNKTYSDEENEAARAALKAAAEKLATATTLDELKAMIDTIEVNEESQLAVNDSENALHTSLNAALSDWLAAEERKEGDIAAIANTSTTKDDDGNETTVVNGYYVAYFTSKNDNSKPMSNVRHLLVKFEGGTENEETGETEYTDAEKAAAKEKADDYLKLWQEGEATEESFIALVKEHSDDTSAEEGGLFEDIHQDSEYVKNFLSWSIDPAREPGNTAVIETEYGYHVMYYVGDDELTYRDYMITNEMRSADQDTWYQGILEPIATAVLDTSKMHLDIVLSAG